MDNPRIVYEDATGITCVVTPAQGFNLDDVIAASVPQGLDYRLVDSTDLTDTPPHVREYKHFTSNEVTAMLEPERRAIMIAKKTDVEIEIFYDDLLASDYVTFSNPKVEIGLNYLVSQGLLTESRKAEIVDVLTSERQ